MVSWPLEEMIISLVMREAPGRGRRHGSRLARAARALIVAARWTARRRLARRRSAAPPEASMACLAADAAGPARSGPADCQFVNRRILTFRMSPNAARVAMIDEPP